ncbi:hypothetical protein V8C86DRAFT_2498977 [Haematococcus lacustris]
MFTLLSLAPFSLPYPVPPPLPSLLPTYFPPSPPPHPTRHAGAWSGQPGARSLELDVVLCCVLLGYSPAQPSPAMGHWA